MGSWNKRKLEAHFFLVENSPLVCMREKEVMLVRSSGVRTGSTPHCTVAWLTKTWAWNVAFRHHRTFPRIHMKAFLNGAVFVILNWKNRTELQSPKTSLTVLVRFGKYQASWLPYQGGRQACKGFTSLFTSAEAGFCSDYLLSIPMQCKVSRRWSFLQQNQNQWF